MSAGRISEAWEAAPLRENWVTYDAKRKAGIPLGSKVRVDTSHLEHLGLGRTTVGTVRDRAAGVHYVHFERLGGTLDVHPHQIKAVKKQGAKARARHLSGPLQEEKHHKLKCPKCDTVQSASNKTCTNCGHDLADARKAKFANLSENAPLQKAAPPMSVRSQAAPRSSQLRVERRSEVSP